MRIQNGRGPNATGAVKLPARDLEEEVTHPRPSMTDTGPCTTHQYIIHPHIGLQTLAGRHQWGWVQSRTIIQ
jgi:hypothetical protein